MAFRDFGFPQVQKELGLVLDEADLSSDVDEVVLRPEFLRSLAQDAKLALAINTEKARSEFIIAPLLLELRREMGGAFGIFSGVEIVADDTLGLNGVCDFLLTKNPLQSVVTSPIIAIVEAKNDALRMGLGRCIASMVAAQILNRQAEAAIPTVFGAVTTGSAWTYLRLAGRAVTLDEAEYYIDRPGKILGILRSFLRAASA